MYFLAERRENVRPAYSGRGYCRIRPARNMIYSEKKGGLKNGLNQKSHVSLRSKEWSVMHVILVMCAAIPKAIKKCERKKNPSAPCQN